MSYTLNHLSQRDEKNDGIKKIQSRLIAACHALMFFLCVLCFTKRKSKLTEIHYIKFST